MSALASADPRNAQTAAAPSHEPVSPELVLVDPELARTERARLAELAQLETFVDLSTLYSSAAPRTLRADDRSKPETRDLVAWSTGQLVRAACLVLAFAGGVFLAIHVSRPAPVVERASPVGRTVPGSAADVQAAPASGPRTPKAAAEQRVISLVLGPARSRLPRQLIDSSTGLVRNNVQAVCQRSVRPGVFDCVVRLSAAAPDAGLYVRYQRNPNGRESLKSYGYRAG